MDQRYQIQSQLKTGLTQTSIAQQLDYHRSTNQRICSQRS
ncbi:hypothetical protein DDD_1720 [Nonlabens dokdonensis DSW-6]|uniref:Uncharacterized protein n=1 Tax=Nonlabens dokdonensis (strain DSM 17205 / KCTC 12402 / DSW-6) TaxID=592029 RepID=L7W9F9_NONDD|nr:hypothetical protein DDD_1720 [Nonlabens dokdonensis DSW-6]